MSGPTRLRGDEPAQIQPRCDWNPEVNKHGDEYGCTKFAQIQIGYVLNRTLLTYNYCPPHAKIVQKDLGEKRIEYFAKSIYVR